MKPKKDKASIKRLYSGLAFLPILVGIVGLIALLHSPYTGVSYTLKDGKWVITGVSGPSSEHNWLEGKEILAIAGFNIKEFDLIEDPDYIPTWNALSHWWDAQKHLSRAVKAGHPFIITVREDTSSRDATITPSSYPISRILSSNFTIMSIVALFTLFIGLVVVIKRPDDSRARVFFLFTVIVGFMDFTFGSYTSRNMAFDIRVFTAFRVINAIAYAFFPAVFLHFCLIFPRAKGPGRKRYFLFLLYLLPVVLSVFFQTRISYLSLNLFFLLSLLGGIVAMHYNYFTLRSPTEKAQVRWVIFGTSIFAIVFLITAYIPILFRGLRLTGDMVPTYFFPLIPLSIAFAITRYRLMDIDSLFDNVLIYGITLGLLVLIDMVVIGFIGSFINMNKYLPPAITLWIVVFTYVPIRERVKKVIRRALRIGDYDLGNEIILLGQRLLTSASVSDVFSVMTKAIERTLAPVGIRAFLIDEKGKILNIKNKDKDRNNSLDIKALQKIAERTQTPHHLYTLIALKDLPIDYSGGVVVPLRGKIGLKGFYILGNKPSGRLYDSRDLKLLKVFSDHTALAIENIQFRDNALSKERELIKEKERISMEIHDGVITELAGIIAYSEKGEMLLKRDADKSSVKEVFTLIGEFSRRGLREIRNVLWAVRPDVTSLDFIAYIKRYCTDHLDGHNIRLDFSHSGIGEDLRFSPEKKLVLLRVLQEACQNIIAHSGTDRAKITLSYQKGWLEVEIADYGRGFVPDKPTAGSGLKNMKKRITDAGGTIEIASQPGAGTRIGIRLPL